MTTSLPEPSTASLFDLETAIEPTGPGRWTAFIRPDWNINTNPNGGYALSPLLRAMAAEVDGHQDPVSLTTHFLRSAVAGQPAELLIDVLRRGRRTSTVRGTMVQAGKARLEAVATFSDLSAGGVDAGVGGLAIDMEPPDLAPPEACVSRLALDQDVMLPLMTRVEVRIDPRYAEPGRAGEATSAGWIRLVDGREPDSLTLPLFSDCFPPSIFALAGRIGWVPTIELTVHVRRRPAPGWIRGRFETKDLAGAMVVEDGILWDSTDRVVARARQLAMATD